MKKLIGLATIGGLLAIGTIRTQAQTTNTNVVLNVVIAMTGYLQITNPPDGNAVVERALISTRSVINLLGRVLGTNFSTHAKLLAVNTVGSGGGGPRFIVRDSVGTTRFDTDVSNYVSAGDLASVRSRRTGAGGRSVSTQYAILEFRLTNTGSEGDFDVQGFSTLAGASHWT